MYSEEYLSSLNILIVEDDPDSRDLYAFIFNSVGANVKLAASASEALQAIETFHPDLVMSDINLPDGNGCSLISQIKEIMQSQGKTIKGIAITGMTDPENKLFKAGFEKYLSKPVDPDNLINVVANMVS